MPLYEVILIVAVIVIVLSLIFHLLFSPITWIIVAILFIYSMIKRHFYQKEMDEYNREFERQAEEKKRAYQSGEAYRSGSDDIIDVNYTEKEDD
ncbi:hypothetical protein [Erysipelatoclostridium sp. AM42-17]|uniref:hypothetical protein n=1 Tax=Erysipelatoclostridium sp. AM42-17 TaxID=2293102 RepID=UPI000E52B826|nr:hypothetical protein [Erysipelatoclostridium sp. AM42-17]RHS94857.1 hypothetical protein DW911_03845 [Erysipelatoclostridium sp. AM42-17]